MLCTYSRSELTRKVAASVVFCVILGPSRRRCPDPVLAVCALAPLKVYCFWRCERAQVPAGPGAGAGNQPACAGSVTRSSSSSVSTSLGRYYYHVVLVCLLLHELRTCTRILYCSSSTVVVLLVYDSNRNRFAAASSFLPLVDEATINTIQS